MNDAKHTPGPWRPVPELSDGACTGRFTVARYTAGPGYVLSEERLSHPDGSWRTFDSIDAAHAAIARACTSQGEGADHGR